MSEKNTNKEGQGSTLAATVDHILQAGYVLFSKDKLSLIHSLLRGKDIPSVLIFTSSKTNAKMVSRELRKLQYDAIDIHEDLDPEKREINLEDFMDNEFQILVVSDILVREISIENVDVIINYDAPTAARDYVERIAKNTRKNHDAVVLTLINDRGQKKFKKIESALGKEVFRISLPKAS